ncbi:hypothetical protein EUTSA_v10022952mg [Eutrema salsugineum]|uniref:Uncharacterized protein n=1 Tax=Eutrema salsugineum TaxID=72664 RepID=V4M4C5_EUTSA|nr:hypothetical protein EUTSA_v10022952mg [Eutrema salsugineum]
MCLGGYGAEETGHLDHLTTIHRRVLGANFHVPAGWKGFCLKHCDKVRGIPDRIPKSPPPSRRLSKGKNK